MNSKLKEHLTVDWEDVGRGMALMFSLAATPSIVKFLAGTSRPPEWFDAAGTISVCPFLALSYSLVRRYLRERRGLPVPEVEPQQSVFVYAILALCLTVAVGSTLALKYLPQQ